MSLPVALNDDTPSEADIIDDRIAQARGEGSSTQPDEFINFCIYICQQTGSEM